MSDHPKGISPLPALRAGRVGGREWITPDMIRHMRPPVRLRLAPEQSLEGVASVSTKRTGETVSNPVQSEHRHMAREILAFPRDESLPSEEHVERVAQLLADHFTILGPQTRGGAEPYPPCTGGSVAGSTPAGSTRLVGWIPVEGSGDDNLPEPGEWVLGYVCSTAANTTYGLNGHRSVLPISRHEDTHEWVHADGEMRVENNAWRVTHWHPLPEPPR